MIAQVALRALAGRRRRKGLFTATARGLRRDIGAARRLAGRAARRGVTRLRRAVGLNGKPTLAQRIRGRQQARGIAKLIRPKEKPFRPKRKPFAKKEKPFTKVERLPGGGAVMQTLVGGRVTRTRFFRPEKRRRKLPPPRPIRPA